MTLSNWQANGWLTEHLTSRQEITDLLALADRDLANATLAGLSADWRLAIGYNAALQSATAALAAAGYRAGRESHHYYVIESLKLTIGADERLVRQLDAFRKKRNLTNYERAGAVSSHEAGELLRLARALRQSVEAWLQQNHPGLVAPQP